MTAQDLAQLADLVAERITPPPILADTRAAARMLGMGVDAFKRDVAPFVKCVRRGAGGRTPDGQGRGRAVRLYVVADLHRWADENATRIADDLQVTA